MTRQQPPNPASQGAKARFALPPTVSDSNTLQIRHWSRHLDASLACRGRVEPDLESVEGFALMLGTDDLETFHHEYGLISFCCSELCCASMSMKVLTLAER